MEVTSIYYKHYPTFKFGNETRVRQGARIPVRASLQSEVSSGAKACSSPPACLLSQHLWITLYMFQTGWGKGSFAQTSDEAYSQVLLHQPLACGQGEVQAPFFAQTQETATNHRKEKGLGSTQDHVPCGLYEKATSVGRNFSQLKVRKNILCHTASLQQYKAKPGLSELRSYIPFPLCVCLQFSVRLLHPTLTKVNKSCQFDV